jgi:hypothetical protein
MFFPSQLDQLLMPVSIVDNGQKGMPSIEFLGTVVFILSIPLSLVVVVVLWLNFWIPHQSYDAKFLTVDHK